jgi:hypothetical protein
VVFYVRANSFEYGMKEAWYNRASFFNLKTMDRKFDLGERLIAFTAAIIDIAEGLPGTFAGNHLAGQLVGVELHRL